MRIDSVDVQIIRLPFRFAFTHSLAKRDFSLNVIVRVGVSDGTSSFIGWGESVPRDYVTGETAESAASFVEKVFAPALLGKSFGEPKELLHLLSEKFEEFDLNRVARGAAWCAFETAILDAYSKARGVSIASLLQSMGIAPSGDAQTQSIVYGGVAPFSRGKKAELLLWLLKFYDYNTVKLKVGRTLDEDVKAVEIARRILGPDKIIRVDANCAWTVEETLRFSDRTSVHSIASIEQPVKPDDIEGLVRITQSIPTPIVVDESLCTYQQAKELVKARACKGFNVRISKNGGLITASKMISLAHEAELEVHLGAQVGESGVLTAAQRQLALVAGTLKNIEGAANFFLLKRDLTQENLTAARGGKPPQLGSPIGLGVSVDEDALAQLLVNQSADANWALAQGRGV